ncbi:hypothetical protein RD792_008936 [Penstemon davidsonii]|uniref:Pectin acetylesterase n=1 Tax=Penstemon davidsonii TaxID=160366 RepID=A0ABR0DBR3_9LAMI|nr:hypothetical protein RD792_008936 [Penstemon davidsonii]
MGDVEEIDPATNLHYRGARIFDAIMEELLVKGMKDASNVILTGCSAGGLATILHCDGFRTLFPGTTRVKCISDGGFFIRAKDLSGAKKREDYFGGVVALHEIAKRLPSSCTSRMDPGLTPLFLLNSAFDSWQTLAKVIGDCLEIIPGGLGFGLGVTGDGVGGGYMV